MSIYMSSQGRLGNNLFQYFFAKILSENLRTDFYIKNGFKKLAYQTDYYELGIGTTFFARRISRC